MAAPRITSGCLDESNLVEYLDGRVTEEFSRQLLDHLDGCRSCFVLLSEVARAARTSDALDEAANAPARERPAEWRPPPIVDEYRVEERIGQGAVGQVYRAIDTRLDRPVAIKFLAVEPEGATRDRFAMEARAVARLSHPNVVAVFRAGEIEGRPFLVSELVRGRGLNQVERPVPWSTALDIGVGLARGLAAAHRAGVLHRDIKPANAILAHDGTVKLLDFGLAKLIEANSARTPSSLSKALVAEAAAGALPSLTATGALLGTPLYMAPEAWRGAASTPQMDIYSVGALLHELCVGAPPHVGASLFEVREKALHHDVTVRTPEVPAPLALVIDRCLRRDAAARPASANALLAELNDARARITAAAAAPARRLRALLFAATTLALVVATFAIVRVRSSHVTPAPWRAQLADQLPTFDENADTPLFSPDGKWLLYASDRDGHWRLYRQPTSGGRAVAITPPGWGVWVPKWSADGRFIYFVDNIRLFRMPSAGGARELVAEHVSYAAVCGEQLALVRPIVPDCSRCERIVLRGVDDPRERELLRTPGNISRIDCDAAGRRLVYLLSDGGGAVPGTGDLWWMGLDDKAAQRLTFDGLARRPTFHPDGQSVLYSAEHDGHVNLWERDLVGGRVEQLTFGEGQDQAAHVARDGSRVVFDVAEPSSPLYAYAADGTARRRLTQAVEDVVNVVPTRDGQALILGVVQNGRPRLVIHALPDGDEHILADGATPVLSADEREVVFTRFAAGVTRIFAVPRAGGAERFVGSVPQPVRWLSVGPDDVVHISLVRYANPPGVWQVPLAGGEPRRELDGSWEIVLAARDYSVAVHAGVEQHVFVKRAAEPWSAARRLPIQQRDNLAWYPDGRTIAYWTGSELRRHDVVNDADSRLFDAPLLRVFGLGIAPDGRTIYAADASSHVRRHFIANYGQRPRPLR